MKTMTDDELKALDAVIDYMATDEMEDFRDNPSAGHIYNAVYALATWRGRNLSTWPKPKVTQAG
ncbi:MAG: hypothetical protein ACLQJR_21535 [Stellaceae bacterium]